MTEYAEIEWLTPSWMFWLFRHRVGVLRVWDMIVEPGIANKMPYAWACTVVHKNSNVIEMKGVVKSPTPFHFRQIVRLLKRLQYKTGLWSRMQSDGKERIVEFTPNAK